MQTSTPKKNKRTIMPFYGLMVVLSVFISTPILAKSYMVLLSGNGDAPTPEKVVDQANDLGSKQDWLLSSFELLQPHKVEYLLKSRPDNHTQLNKIEFIDSNLAKLNRYLVVDYPDEVSDQAIMDSLNQDPHVVSFYLNDSYEYLPYKYNRGNKVKIDALETNSKAFDADFITDLNIASAWELSEGMGYIGALDTGFQTNHAALITFDAAGNYLGGNLLDASGVMGFSYQEDVGINDFNVDERQAISTNGWPIYENCDLEDGVNDDFATPYYVSHGTHVTGILVGKSNQLSGVCKNCGMSMMKFLRPGSGQSGCRENNDGEYYWQQGYGDAEAAESLVNLANLGVGTVNYSGGYGSSGSAKSCAANPNGVLCMALQTLISRNILLVAAAGNSRWTTPQYPAREVGTIAVGGLDESGTFWNESPGPLGQTDPSDVTNCPYWAEYQDAGECGTNFSTGSPLGQKLDVMTQARTVYSTFYYGAEYIPQLDCTDASDGVIDGYGYCTGTSMSTPQVAGIVQLMRSAHPLLPNGTYDPTQMLGLINVLNATSSQSTSDLGIDNHFGYGIPDARLALETILGQSNEQQMSTRLTPMFELYSSGASNNIYTPFSQVAVSFLSRPGFSYTSNSSANPVSEFAEFWYDQSSASYAAPKADFYVFTTNNNHFTGTKNMVPLRRMEKTTGSNRNDTYVVDATEIKNYRLNGYNFAGIEGYILPPCSPQPKCIIPIGSTPLYRDESNSMNHQLIPANSAPNGSSTLLGYVYLNQDTDNDGLIDGQEIILGTNLNDVDTDGDGESDSEEYPPAGVPVSDPLINQNKLDWLPAVINLMLD